MTVESYKSGYVERHYDKVYRKPVVIELQPDEGLSDLLADTEHINSKYLVCKNFQKEKISHKNEAGTNELSITQFAWESLGSILN